MRYALLVYYTKTYVNYFVNPLKKFRGQDKLMARCYEEGHVISYWTFDSPITETDFETITNIFLTKLKNPRCDLRLRGNSKRYWLDKTAADDMIKTLLNRKYSDTMNLKECLLFAQEHQSTCVLFVYNQGIVMTGHHALFDATKYYESVFSWFTNVTLTKYLRKVPIFPVLSEIKVLASKKMMPKKRLLAHNSRSDLPLSTYRNTSSTSEFKKRKTALDSSFVGTLITEICHGVFKSTKPYITRLNVAIPVAFKGKNRHNNIGAIVICVKRSFDVTAIAKDVSAQLKKNKSMAVSTLIMTNVWDVSWKNDRIDVMVSCIPLNKDDEVTFLNKKCKIHTWNPYPGACIYALAQSDAVNVHYSLTVATPDVNINTLKTMLDLKVDDVHCC
jgi:hypothetical protein